MNVFGDYNSAEDEQPPFKITHGYSKDKRPDLKQFVLSLLCVDGDIPIVGKLEDGNASDKKINHRVLDAGGSFAEETEKLAVAFPQHANFLRSFFSRWVEALNGAVDENVRVLSSLKRANIPIHMISNINHETFEKACELFPFLNEFDHCIVSGRIGLVKPDREIFEYWSQETGVHPIRAVFIDDNANNIATADALGFHTVHYTEGKIDVRARLVALGVPIQEA